MSTYNIFFMENKEKRKTRIPQAAASHLLGQKSQETQSERGY